MNVHNLLSIHQCAKFGMPVSKSKEDLAKTQIHGENIILILTKSQGQTQVMNVFDILSHGDTLMCQIWYDYVKGQKSCALNTKPCQKPYKLDPEVKGQFRIGIMNVRNTSLW